MVDAATVAAAESRNDPGVDFVGVKLRAMAIAPLSDCSATNIKHRIARLMGRARCERCPPYDVTRAPNDQAPRCADCLLRRALNQLCRELLLAQSSDWAFIMKTGTAVKYATDRIKGHLSRFAQLARQVGAPVSGSPSGEAERGAVAATATPATIDQDFLAELERRDNNFPDVDFRLYA